MPEAADARTAREGSGTPPAGEGRDPYRAGFRGAPLPMWVVEHGSGRFLEVNAAAIRRYGYAREEWLRMSLRDLRSPEGDGCLEELLQSGVREGLEGSYGQGGRWCHLRADGSEILVEVAYSPLRWEGKRAWLLVASDVTDAVRVVERLRSSEERFRLLVEGVTDHALFLLDAEGRVSSWNPGAERIHGYRAEAILGAPYARFHPLEDAERGVPEGNLRVARETGRFEGQGWRVRADGSRFRAQVTLTALRDGDGSLRGFAKVTRDITERCLAEDTLRRETGFVRLLQDVAVASNGASSPEEALRFTLERVASHTGWPVGHAYLLDPADGNLVSSGLWHLEQPRRFEAFRRASEALRFRPGEGLPGRVLATGRPEWTEDVTASPGWAGVRADADLGVRGGFAFPALAGRRVVAVLEFFDAEPARPDRRLLEVVAHIGAQLGRVHERRQWRTALEASREQLRALARRLQSVREEEQKRISRAVHDDLGQEMTALKMDLAWIAERTTGADAAVVQRVRAALVQVDRTIAGVRRIAAQFRPAILEELGLAPALEWFTERFREQAGLEVRLDLRADDRRIGSEEAVAVYRTAQEALTNVVRHAGARRVSVVLEEDAGGLVLRVEDDGRGILPGEAEGPAALGILGMRERARSLGGRLDIGGRSGRGTRVVLRIPRDRREEEQEEGEVEG